ncbi:MAG: hypothetical protein LBG44_07360 [Gemmatimonadota bacterium]|nr:hypothetical protein [Gemmatimonadota bacterium]
MSDPCVSAGGSFRITLSTLVRTAVILCGLLITGTPVTRTLEAQNRHLLTSERQLWSDRPLDVTVEFGGGRLQLRPAEAPTLYRMELTYDQRVIEPVIRFSEELGTLHLGVPSVRDRERRNSREGSSALIALTRTVPLDLDLKFGLGRADIELGGLSLRNLSLSTGASETTVSFGSANPLMAEAVRITAGAAELTVHNLGNARARMIRFKGGMGSTVLDFGGDWVQNANASIEMGVGSVTIRLPRALGVQIHRSSVLSSFSAPEMEQKDNSYFSANWNTTSTQLTIDLSAALGSVTVEWIE